MKPLRNVLFVLTIPLVLSFGFAANAAEPTLAELWELVKQQREIDQIKIALEKYHQSSSVTENKTEELEAQIIATALTWVSATSSKRHIPAKRRSPFGDCVCGRDRLRFSPDHHKSLRPHLAQLSFERIRG